MFNAGIYSVAHTSGCVGTLETPYPKRSPSHLKYTDVVVNERVTINVSGTRFETNLATLERFPNTLMGNPHLRLNYYDAKKKEYFFDRSKAVFECILFFYQSGGRLLSPQDITYEEFWEELHFWKMGEEVATRFAKTYCPHVLRLSEDEAILPANKYQRLIWRCVEKPDSSLAARIFAGISLIMIAGSIIVLCAESMTDLVDVYVINVTEVNQSNAFDSTVGTDEGEYSKFESRDFHQYERRNSPNPYLLMGETVTMTWFTIELIIRFAVSPNKSKFFQHILNMCDAVSIIPFHVFILIKLTGYTIGFDKAKPLAMLRMTRLVKVFPLFKLTRHSKNLQILTKTFKASINELGLLIFFFTISVVLFSSGVYLAEHDNKSTNQVHKFESIPHSFWWAIVTMSTVGYGDMVPITLLGKLIGTLCALVGILTLSLPVPIIVSNFSFYYQSGNNDDSNIGETIHRYSLMGPTVTKRPKK